MSAGSDDDQGFLGRWARRKAQIREQEKAQEKAREKEQAERGSGPPAEADATAAAEPDAPFDLESLPKLEDITAETDLTVFLRKGVPESLRNAALRRAWAIDPAIRDYVSPAREYAWDWNVPGGAPVGPLEAGYDAAREVARMLSRPSQTLGEERPATEAAAAPDEAPATAVEPVATSPAQPAEPPARIAEAPAETGASASDDAAGEGERTADPERLRRVRPRHGGAAPA